MSTLRVLAEQQGPPKPDPFLSRDATAEDGKHRPRVFVVDDERLIADTLVEILNESGDFMATAVYDAADALQEVRREAPDIVLADVVMPEMNGIALAKKIRSACPRTRIVRAASKIRTAATLFGDCRKSGISRMLS